MNLFTEFMNRFKSQVGLSKDREIAELLGIGVTAFSERKRRDSVPIKEVFYLAKLRPDLKLDPDWIVTGTSKRLDTQDIDERHLVECYRMMGANDKSALTRVASALSGITQNSAIFSKPERKE